MTRAYCEPCGRFHATHLVGEARRLHSIALLNCDYAALRTWTRSRDDAEKKARIRRQANGGF